MDRKTPAKPTFSFASVRRPDPTTAKTPFQSSGNNLLQQRLFRSEVQPRISTRPARPDPNQNPETNSILSRLGFISSKAPPVSVAPTANVLTKTAEKSRLFTSSKTPFSFATPGNSLRSNTTNNNNNNNTTYHHAQQNQRHQQQQQQPQQPPQQPQQQQQQQQPQQQQQVQRAQPVIVIPAKTPLHISHHANPLATSDPQHRLLIQDTRMPNNKLGPISTATKAPLSVCQYTQPTPSSNKSNHQVSRAHSEPSIKYQVRVNDKTYKILRKIGSGGSAKVYEGFEPSTYQTVAIKIINVAKADPKTQESYFNERLLLERLQNSKHVVKMFNSEYKAECKELVIVMEKGDADLSQVLDTHFKQRSAGCIDGIFIKFYWRGMLLAVDEIHRNGIVHADLKPVNFVLVKNQIKLIDFGIASTIDPEVTSVVRDYQIGTINYMAPETLKNRASDSSFVLMATMNDNLDIENNPQQRKVKKTLIKYNSKADIWSLGCILYNLVYGKPPFDGYHDVLSKMQAIINPRHSIEFPEINNRALLGCMKQCLRYDPADRPTAEELLNDSYLQEDIVIMKK